MSPIIYVALGGALGSAARYAVSRIIQEQAATAFPLHTMTVNVAGCLLIGLIGGMAQRTGSMPAAFRLFLTVGFCGGFTTFSTFCNEAFALMRGSQCLVAAAYAALSLFLGLLAVCAGNMLARL